MAASWALDLRAPKCRLLTVSTKQRLRVRLRAHVPVQRLPCRIVTGPLCAWVSVPLGLLLRVCALQVPS